MRVTNPQFRAYLECPTKCFLIATGMKGDQSSFSEFRRLRDDQYRNEIISLSQALTPTANNARGGLCLGEIQNKNKGSLQHFCASSNTMQSNIDLIEVCDCQKQKTKSRYISIRYISSNKVSKVDKMLAAFDGIALEKAIGISVPSSVIFYGERHEHIKLRLDKFRAQVEDAVRKIEMLFESDKEPDLILNRHCNECEFKERCKSIAEKNDDLSLLGGMSRNALQSLKAKGIFTVTQLSYTYRSRRKPKHLADQKESYNPSLKALSIRENKIHVVGSPEFSISGTPVYLDVEGVPDRDFYYLIGMRYKDTGKDVALSFWANEYGDEKRIWADFQNTLMGIEKPVLVHYGSYETKFLRLMTDRYGASEAEGEMFFSAVNLFSVLYAKIYFPTYSNGLKEISAWLGFRYSLPDANGLMAIRWREEWEQHGKCEDIKQKLVLYNAEDCQAAEKIALTIKALCDKNDSDSLDSDSIDAVHTDELMHEGFQRFGKTDFLLPEFAQINKAAYWDYQREKILARNRAETKKTVSRNVKFRTNKDSINKLIDIPPPSCSSCGESKIYTHAYRTRVITDLRLTGTCVKKWITRYRIIRGRCQTCKRVLDDKSKFLTGEKYGSVLQAFCVYQNIELHLSQGVLVSFLNNVLGLNIARVAPNKFKSKAAIYYRDTYQKILNNIVNGKLVHADETKVNIQGQSRFIWVFTNLEEVAYVYSATREGGLVRSLLKEFKGVLVSDFYSAYDGIDCPQQKCLIHLIRDLNEDLRRFPFNSEIRTIVASFANLLKPIIETVDQYGLKARFLHKHKRDVNKFYGRLTGEEWRSDIALKWKRRLIKTRDTLFTFLDYDQVPWNNNNAEHAIKSIALLRNVIGGSSTEAGIQEYLVLASICETCKLQNVNFLDFLLSKERNIQNFLASKKLRRSRIFTPPSNN